MWQDLLLAETIDAARCDLPGPMRQLGRIHGWHSEAREVCAKNVWAKKRFGFDWHRFAAPA